MTKIHGNEYENMITAIAAYFMMIETDIESDPNSDEKHDPDHISGAWIADTLGADKDAMDEVARRIAAHIKTLRKLSPFSSHETPPMLDHTYLISMLYDYVGEEREVSDSDFEAFVADKMSAGRFPEFSNVHDVQVPDSDVAAWQGAFDDYLKHKGEPICYTIQINEHQRRILLDAMQLYPKTDEVEDALVVDLRDLPSDAACMPGSIVAFCP